jgi:hypothetical protein
MNSHPRQRRPPPAHGFTGLGRSVRGTYFGQPHPDTRHRPRRRLGCPDWQSHAVAEHGGEVQS